MCRQRTKEAAKHKGGREDATPHHTGIYGPSSDSPKPRFLFSFFAIFSFEGHFLEFTNTSSSEVMDYASPHHHATTASLRRL